MDRETFIRTMPIPEATILWRRIEDQKDITREEGRAAVALKLLEAGMEFDEVSKYTGFDNWELNHL